MSTRRQMGAMLLASLSLVSCNNLLHQTPAPPDAYQPSSALAPVVSKSSASFTAQNRQQARAYCLSHLNSLSSSFTLKFDYGNVNTEMNAVVQDMLNSGVATAMQMESLGNRVTFIPEYSDCVVMLRAHRQPHLAAALPPRTQKALQMAQNLVQSICAQYPGQYERALALHDYLALNTRYDSGLGIAAQPQATTRLLLDGVAVCDGYAHAYGMLLSMAGIENRFVVGYGDGIEHIWNLVRLEGKWVHIDVTYDDPKPDRSGRVMHSYFAMSDAQLAANHQWKRADFPAAASDALYYPFRLGLRFASVQELLLWADSRQYLRPWADTFFVDELQSMRSEADSYRYIQAVANRVGSRTLKSVALDKGCRGAVYCSFKN
ncbi:MAG: hypothetical protein E7033_01175 [Akkermansiaceae bacterium]|nr:hypothetical protein [Akkermansiaceae bacterium]